MRIQKLNGGIPDEGARSSKVDILSEDLDQVMGTLEGQGEISQDRLKAYS